MKCTVCIGPGLRVKYTNRVYNMYNINNIINTHLVYNIVNTHLVYNRVVCTFSTHILQAIQL